MSKKEKLFASAQKNLQKGQISKALRDYRKLVEIDPGEVRNRQRLAELYSRVGSTKEALAEFETVANYYAENGFHLKAIAVCKQIQKLDPGQAEVYRRLAELNEKQGLVGNALSEYRSLADLYQAKQMNSEAIEVLERMKGLAPDNLNIRVKIAESYAQGGHKEKGREEFREVLALLEQKGAYSRIIKLYEIILPLYPDDPEMESGLARTLVQKGDVEEGIRLLTRLSESHPNNKTVLGTLAMGFGRRGDYARQKDTLLRLLDERPGDLDARQQYVEACLNAGENEEALQKLDGWRGAFLEDQRIKPLKAFYERLKEAQPENEQILRALKSIYEISGEGGKLFDLLSEGEEEKKPSDEIEIELPAEELEIAVEPVPGEVEAGQEQVDEVAELLEEGIDIPSSSKANPDLEELEEIPLEYLEEVVDAEKSEDAPQPSEVASADQEDHELELEIELELDEPFVSAGTGASTETPAGTTDSDPTEEALRELEASLEFEEEAPAAFKPGCDPEEAEFYLQQGLLDEAERICRTILAIDPENRDALDKLATVESRRGGKISDSKGREEYFDLASEILEGNDDSASAEMFAPSEEGQFPWEAEPLSGMAGTDAAVDLEETESHYNLGIAYKEMGLLDEAVAEFDQAMANSVRRLDCLTLKGICLTEKGAFEAAREAFKSALASPHLEDGQRASLHYELGAMFEAWSRPQEALESYQRSAEIDGLFRDVGEKIRALKTEHGLDGGSVGGKGKKNRVSYV